MSDPIHDLVGASPALANVIAFIGTVAGCDDSGKRSHSRPKGRSGRRSYRHSFAPTPAQWRQHADRQAG